MHWMNKQMNKKKSKWIKSMEQEIWGEGSEFTSGRQQLDVVHPGDSIWETQA